MAWRGEVEKHICPGKAPAAPVRTPCTAGAPGCIPGSFRPRFSWRLRGCRTKAASYFSFFSVSMNCCPINGSRCTRRGKTGRTCKDRDWLNDWKEGVGRMHTLRPPASTRTPPLWPPRRDAQRCANCEPTPRPPRLGSESQTIKRLY
jgi:hypothetical protein